jgi:hypothetical protein
VVRYPGSYATELNPDECSQKDNRLVLNRLTPQNNISSLERLTFQIVHKFIIVSTTATPCHPDRILLPSFYLCSALYKMTGDLMVK